MLRKQASGRGENHCVCGPRALLSHFLSHGERFCVAAGGLIVLSAALQVELLANRQVTVDDLRELAELARQLLLYITTKLLGFQKRDFER